jgi:hypothetical protein
MSSLKNFPAKNTIRFRIYESSSEFYTKHLRLKKFPPEKSTQKQNYDTTVRY